MPAHGPPGRYDTGGNMSKVLVDLDFLEDGLESICAAIRLKTGGTGLLAFPVEIKNAVDSIETGSGGITPTGKKTITENGENIDVTTYAAVDVNVQSGSDTSDATAAAGDIAADKTAYIATGKTTGAAAVRTSSDLSASGKTVTVPAGIYRTQATKDVQTAAQATPSVSVDQESGLVTATASQSAGYVEAGTKSGTLQLSAKDAATITPGTADQEIPAGKYLTGKQTVKGDARLVPANIKSGVEIFGVTGSYAGGDDLDIDYGSYSATSWGSVMYNTLTITVPNSSYSGDVKAAHIYMKGLPNALSVGTIISMIILPEGANKFQADIGVLSGGVTVHNSGTVFSVSKGASETTITITAGMYISYLAEYAEFATGGDYYAVTLITG